MNYSNNLNGSIECIAGAHAGWSRSLGKDDVLIIGSSPEMSHLVINDPLIAPRQCAVRYDRARNVYSLYTENPERLSLERLVHEEGNWKFIAPGSRFAMGDHWGQVFRVGTQSNGVAPSLSVSPGTAAELKPENKSPNKAKSAPRFKKLIPFLLVIVLFAAGAILYSNHPAVKFRRMLNLGTKYLTEMDYEQAELALLKAIELEPRSIEAYDILALVYEGKGETEKAAKALEDGLNAVGTDIFPDRAMMHLTFLYENLADEAADNGDYERAYQFLSRLSELHPDDSTYKERMQELKRTQEEPETEQTSSVSSVSSVSGKDFEAEINALIAMLKANPDEDYRSIDFFSENLSAFSQTLETPYVFQAEDGKYAGIYPGGYVYYGDMVNGQRQGNGWWILSTPYTNALYDCEWANDVPNGHTELTQWNRSSLTNVKMAAIQKKSGTVESGIYVGKWTQYSKTFYPDREFPEDTAEFSYTDGHMDVIEINGDTKISARGEHTSYSPPDDPDYVFRVPGI